ncbi:UNVERIFIED_CONTAM: hypothetical protein Sangu_1728900 [Sesamum angustifolium]|uniref:Uncharacterized protein n=1 Tax=Sesamum angustifolium TaxID=2727405 RepID=A0AAW2M4Q2_9LAMI
MASTICELLWLSYLLCDFCIPVQEPIPFWCDDKAALHITANLIFHERTKHLDIDCYLVRDQFKLGFIFLPTSVVLANLLTFSPKLLLLLFFPVYCPIWAWVPKFHLEGGCYISIIISADLWALTKEQDDVVSI